MKKISFLGLLVCIGLFAIVGTENSVAKPDKVTICHIPPGNPDNAHDITVSMNAVPAHLAHGDILGGCEVPQ